MRKIYVMDTNILIHAPEAILNFEDNEVVIPMTVLEELDGLKNSEKEKGRNAREAIRHLENLLIQGNLVAGVDTEQGGIIRIEKIMLICNFHRICLKIRWTIGAIQIIRRNML